jgi:hypothetical protein
MPKTLFVGLDVHKETSPLPLPKKRGLGRSVLTAPSPTHRKRLASCSVSSAGRERTFSRATKPAPADTTFIAKSLPPGITATLSLQAVSHVQPATA